MDEDLKYTYRTITSMHKFSSRTKWGCKIGSDGMIFYYSMCKSKTRAGVRYRRLVRLHKRLRK